MVYKVEVTCSDDGTVGFYIRDRGRVVAGAQNANQKDILDLARAYMDLWDAIRAYEVKKMQEATE
jgi:hypothetical protein